MGAVPITERGTIDGDDFEYDRTENKPEADTGLYAKGEFAFFLFFGYVGGGSFGFGSLLK